MTYQQIVDKWKRKAEQLAGNSVPFALSAREKRAVRGQLFECIRDLEQTVAEDQGTG